MAKVTRAAISDFLAARTIAVIGASRDEKTYADSLFAELLKHGYEAIPVNPHAETIAGKRVYKNVTEIRPIPERALILLPEDKTEQAVIDCADAGIRRVWLHRHVGGGVSDTRAIFRA
jgi:predicted CoA-binding protein